MSVKDFTSPTDVCIHVPFKYLKTAAAEVQFHPPLEFTDGLEGHFSNCGDKNIIQGDRVHRTFWEKEMHSCGHILRKASLNSPYLDKWVSAGRQATGFFLKSPTFM
jgi:hypothetical protein